jgi:flagellar protein FliO/FliZ
MTRQMTQNGRQRTVALLRLCRAIYINVPFRGAQKSALCLLSSAVCCLSSAYATEVARPAYIPPPPAVSSGNIAQIIFSLLLVLAAIVLVGWMLKRMNVAQQGSVKLLKVLGAVPIGQRERIVLVEIKDTWLVVGVGPGQIRTLHSLPKMEYSATDLQHTEAQSSGTKFSSLLSSVLNHRKQKVTDK